MKIFKTALVCILIMTAVVSTASASKDSVQDTMSTLKDQVSAMGYVVSDDYSYASVSATAGDNSEASAYTEGGGNWLYIISGIYMETDNPVEGTGYAYISGDDVSSGSEASADSSGYYNSISIETYIQGIGNTEGYSWLYGWE